MSYIAMSNIDVTMGIIISLQVSEENSFSDSKHDLPVLEIKVIQEGHLDAFFIIFDLRHLFHICKSLFVVTVTE